MGREREDESGKRREGERERAIVPGSSKKTLGFKLKINVINSTKLSSDLVKIREGM